MSRSDGNFRKNLENLREYPHKLYTVMTGTCSMFNGINGKTVVTGNRFVFLTH